jgi:hypothetical protein
MIYFNDDLSGDLPGKEYVFN